ncbi:MULTISPECIES: PTS mannose/fructose/sorbose/N-acetylgalactosamine transporter subunit IIC [Tetragenococcus]|uniref:PTS mannose/fructose/sorbose/N-acetylgalactosamine transporter subunit IIC n=1 Tax=Tetragenococcus TaxID=51668 RepID=UPI00083DAAE7|nr:MULTISPECIES: PTS sugar transporter subunit IIC [Tetragenococcus]AOF48299.1 PTS N-acetylgalactosamine transporter subunit IID [Tetragenococcus halophilus]MCF1622576.1 PTS sugar transporter subunit IIC [Tetragenococcus koreensis]MCF1642956.1 PTS sugar transporter subunit IIC [Tetragenococcus koreensis]MCF1681096.1 PTS sugar transporter subunit IIC [Tetragenococcus koreensis]MCF1683310.1 PTS sugar transporter subunit IIC [Tetragenococcus koreensis]
MHISFFQAILIGFIYFLGINAQPWLTTVGTHMIMRPMVNGTLVGLVLGKPIEGCIIGTAINLPYLAWISAGGSVPMDPALAGTLGTALAIAGGVNASAATTLAVPLGLLGTVIWVVHMTVDISFLHMADKAAEEGNTKKLNFLNIWPPQIIVFLMSVIPVALAVYYGAGPVAQVVNMMEGKPLDVLSVIGAILPALGIAMNLRAMSGKGILLFFIFGFLVTVYSDIPILALSVFGVFVVYIYTELTFKEDKNKAV